jgi:ankyrin repeat protein
MCTALGAASARGELPAVELLLESGADPNIEGENTVHIIDNLPKPPKFRPVCMARHWGQPFCGAFELVKLLLESDANPNVHGEISMSTLK